MMIIGDQYGFYQLVLRKHACRLRYILHQLNSGQLPLEDLKRNIEYAALVLETAYMDETRRICDEDDDLAEVTPEAVPEEVREWLAATFTRQAVQPKREKPKFKSVANAIRTGIFFEKIFRRTQVVLAPIPNEYKGYLRNINNWNFNSFELDEFTNGHALKYVGFEIFNRYGFLERFKINVQILEHFLLALEVGYSKHNNPYHNCVHAADVTQTSHWILSQTGLASTLTDLELLAVLFGALIHDYEHTGHTNNFHIQSGSHASKPWDLHYRWTEGVLEEFFRQGDLEASMGLPYSPLCDRHTTHVAESQIGFIDFIVEPTMVVCGEMLTKMVEPLVSLPSSDSLFPPGQNAADADGSASATSLSPLPPDLKSPSPGNPVSVRKIPINYFGKLEIPSPWIRHLQENKSNWRERAVKEEAERNRIQQEKLQQLTNGHTNSTTEIGNELIKEDH
uniref:Phosphodiesterase n=1 Tax=Meloidogyne hapla TaxID=6305 RepID=A0A1I8BNG5_MELHA